MKHIRPSKNKKAIRRLNLKPIVQTNTSEIDAHVFDTVLQTLYNNADKDILSLEKDIYAPNNIKLSLKHSERLWEVMLSSGWVSPVIGFGNSGKVSLTQTGYQLMAQYGGFKQYLEAQKAAMQQQPQTIILPLQIQGEEGEQPAPKQQPQKAAEEKNGPKTN